MFKNIKKASEYSLTSEIRLFKTEGTASRAPSERPAETPSNKERLADLRDIVSANFEDHLRKNKDGIRVFIGKCKEKPYQSGQWAEWNRDFLKAMGYEKISQQEADGVVRQLEIYLKERGSRVIVEGKLGPNGLGALAEHMESLDKNEGWVEGVTKLAFFDSKGQAVYLTHDGRWVDRQHKDVDLQTVLPEIATQAQPDELGYFAVDVNKGKVYVDRNGAVYEKKPDKPGPTEWSIYEETDEWDKRKEKAVAMAKAGAISQPPTAEAAAAEAIEKLSELDATFFELSQKPSGLRVFYHRLKDGSWLNDKNIKVPAKEALQAVKRESKDGIYQLVQADNLVRYFKENGKEVAGYGEKKEEETATPPVKPDFRPRGPEDELVANQFEVNKSDGSKENYYRFSDGTYKNAEYKDVPAAEVLPLIATATFKRPNGEKFYQVMEKNAEVYYDEAGHRQKTGRPFDADRVMEEKSV